MDRELYGREAIFGDDGLAARLTGITPYGSVKAAYEHREDLPVVVLTGGRGMGKTAVLKQLRNVYQEITPVALIDCEAIVPPENPGPGWTPVTGALPALAVQLARRVRAAKGVQFPRLVLGLAAVASTSWNHEDGTQAQDDLLALGPVLATVSPGAGAAQGWVAKVLSKLASTALDVMAPLAGVAAEATVETVLEETFKRRQRRSAQWYGDYPHAGGRGTVGLRQLAIDFERGGDLRRRAEGHLVSALVEDLCRAYRGPSSGTRRGRPVILLDNVHTELGRQLVEPVLRQRAAGSHDRIAFLTTSRSREHEGLRHAVHHRLPEVAHTSRWERTGEVTSGILAVELTALSAAHAQAAFEHHDPAAHAPAGLARGVHRLSGGRPLAVSLFAQAAGEATEPRALLPGTLLDRTVELREDQEPVRVGDELLRQMLPGQRLDLLSVLAASHGEESARQLARIRLRGESLDGDVALRMRDVLRTEGWQVGPSHFVEDPLLRALLLHRLRFQDDDHPEYAVWRAVHESLRDIYATGTMASPPHELRQELVLGDTGCAVTHLRSCFGHPDVLQWLCELRFIASAPYPHQRSAHGPDPRRAVALGKDLAAESPPDTQTGLAGLDETAAALQLQLRRLLHAVWLLSDPLALPDEEVIDKMAHEFRQLSGQHLTGNSVLWDAAAHWPRDIRALRPLSMPPGERRTDPSLLVPQTRAGDPDA